MIDLNELYSEKNLGLPVKVRMGRNKNNPTEDVYMYGRYYGRGYDGEGSIYEEDYDWTILTMVTPGGTFVRGGMIYFEQITEQEDLLKFKEFEKLSKENYYHPYLIKKDDKFYKSYEYKKEPLTFNHYPVKWFEENGYLSIDKNLLGNNLSYLFSLHFNTKYYFNEIYFTYKGKTDSRLNYYNIESSRHILLISPQKYNETYNQHFSDYSYRDRDYFDTMFKQKPISIKENEYLLYFHYVNKSQIKLGKVENKEFIPDINYPFRDGNGSCFKEVNYNNQKFSFIEDFIKAIITYKLNNRKPNLTQKDINIILEQFGITRKNEIHKLISVLKNTNEKTNYILSEINSVGKILKLEKRKE